MLFVFTGCIEVVVSFEENVKPITVSDEITITGLQFGIFDINGGTYTLIEKNEIPLVVGQAYGWAIRLQTKEKEIQTRQIYTLPSPPNKWNDPHGVVTDVSPDKKVSETEIEMKVRDGLVYGIWKVVEGDPEGESKIEVYLDGNYATSFTFKIIKP